MYEYRAKLIKVIDGDTVDLDIDLGFNVHINPMRFRLAGLNAPEKNSKNVAERAAAATASATLEALLKDSPLVVKTEKDSQEKYGRYLANIWVGTLCVNVEMIRLGHATAYNGVGPMPVWPWQTTAP